MTKANIEDLLQTAFTSYALIKHRTEKDATPIVLGGYWGAGIFMNHPRVVVIVQLIAAQLAGVDFQFHDFPERFYPGHFAASKEYFDKELSPMISSGTTVGEVVDKFFDYLHKQG